MKKTIVLENKNIDIMDIFLEKGDIGINLATATDKKTTKAQESRQSKSSRVKTKTSALKKHITIKRNGLRDLVQCKQVWKKKCNKENKTTGRIKGLV